MFVSAPEDQRSNPFVSAANDALFDAIIPIKSPYVTLQFNKNDAASHRSPSDPITHFAANGRVNIAYAHRYRYEPITMDLKQYYDYIADPVTTCSVRY